MFSSKKTPHEFCPLIKGACVGDACKFHVHIMGKHPQSGADLDMADCAVRWLPTLLIENSQQTRQAAASVDKMASEAAKAGLTIAGALAHVQREIRVVAQSPVTRLINEADYENRDN
jgi:hypothetical protein